MVTLGPGFKVRTKVGQMVALSDQVKRRLARYLSHYGGHLDDGFNPKKPSNFLFGLIYVEVVKEICQVCRYIKQVVLLGYILYSWSSIGQFKSVSVYRALVVWNG